MQVNCTQTTRGHCFVVFKRINSFEMSEAMILSPVVIFLATLVATSQPRFTIKAERNKAFDEFTRIATFHIRGENIAECLEHCLQDCRCQSFQICQNTKCQLCSSHKKENSSLLHEEDGCVYATYEMRQPTRVFQNFDGHCSDMRCSISGYCCQQSGLCSENMTCKPFNSPTKPWKRFTCECPDGYHGNDCQTPITSCQGYAKSSGTSGMYKLVDSVHNSLYDVYCHFDSDGAWTLVLSNSFNGNGLRNSLSENRPVNENDLTWSGYRLSKHRMKSIKENSTYLQFTCNYEKLYDIDDMDHVQMPLASFESSNESTDILELTNKRTLPVAVGEGRGKIGVDDLYGCQIKLHQRTNRPLHVHVKITATFEPSGCTISDFPCSDGGNYFNSYSSRNCGDECDCDNIEHGCVQNELSTTQLWFGTPTADGASAPGI